jgi:large subunit ribosomal protein L17
MRHHIPEKKLGRKGSHRSALIRNLLTSFLENERVETTHTRCKVLKREMDKLVTMAKRGDLHSKRLAAARLFKKSLVTKLFDEIAPRYVGRPGGYTRIIPTKIRLGDAAAVSIIEFIPGEKSVAAEAPKPEEAKAEAPRTEPAEKAE